MGRRIFLFLLTNLAVVLTVSIVLSLLGVDRYVVNGGVDVGSLMVFCFVWGMGGAFISLLISRWSAKRAMGIRLIEGRTGSRELDWLYDTVAKQARQANLPMPEVGIYDSAEVNAFATGPSRSRSLVAVSTGLLRSMRPDEVEGVLAHEMSHVANGDMVTMALLQGIVNAFAMFLARIIAIALQRRDGERSYGPNPFLVMIIQMVLMVLGSIITAWFSRQREFRADRGGATLAGRERMVAALRRLQSTHELVDPHHTELATLKISGVQGWMALFSTHPPLETRIAALERVSV
jgi:heat shock protein HtpX